MGQNTQASLDSFKCLTTLEADGRKYQYFDLKRAEKNGLEGIAKLPFSLKILLENLLRFEDGKTVTADDIRAVVACGSGQTVEREIAFRPARVLMQDFTGVPAVVDLAAMRNAMQDLGSDPTRINPQVPVDLVIDHSVMVDFSGSPEAFAQNVAREYERNKERYEFLRWGGAAFDNFRVVPPGTGICHQVNLEHLAKVVWTSGDDELPFAFPDTLVGTDSHTVMVNGLSVLGWGVGGIEAEAAMLGQPVSMLIPEVVGVRLTGEMAQGVTATDLVLRVVEMLRQKGVVGKFVEFFGPGLDHLSLEDQATVANMAPEYGATCGIFPIDDDTLNFLNATGRGGDVALVESYARAQGLYRESDDDEPVFSSTLELDLRTIEPAIAGPSQPKDRIVLGKAKTAFAAALKDHFGVTGNAERIAVAGRDFAITHGDIVIAAITSCTNTSNPSVMIGAGLVARNARKLGLRPKPWVKTSLAPGSQVVTDYLQRAGLQDDLDALGFQNVGYGCTTCIGNSGPLLEGISGAIAKGDLVSCSVLSSNRNFEGRVNPDVRANYLASPPLVVAYALAGSLTRDITTEPLGKGRDGQPVYLKDIWPDSKEIAELIRTSLTPEMFEKRYADVFKGDARWQAVPSGGGLTYNWNVSSTYVQNPPYFEGITMEPDKINDIENARILGLFGDSITTDHISPAGSIKEDSPAGRYLKDHQVPPRGFNSYGSRRGNHEVMMRGTFANIRIRNQMAPGTEGGVTRHYPSGELMPIYDAAMRYQQENVPLVVIAGREYGTGSSRDWAAKGTRLLGVRAVITRSFERIHRSNLIGMGVLPLTFEEGTSWQSLGLKGDETLTVSGLNAIEPRMLMKAGIKFADGREEEISLLCRIDTEDELEYFRHGGILQYVLRNLAG